jgi:uncharacterized protein (DUF1015 family)
MLDQAIVGREPAMDLTELYERDVRQRLWAVTDRDVIEALQGEMAPKRNVIIADGHHRYETALTYQQEMQQRCPHAPGNAAFNYCMASLVSMDDPGLIVLPTHREVYNWPQVEGSEILARAEPLFEILPAGDLAHCLDTMRAHEQRHAFGFYDGQYRVLVVRPGVSIDREISGPRSSTWKSLDVSILHGMILEPLVGLGQDQAETEEHLRYHRDPQLAIDNVDAGRGEYALLVNATRIAQVQACAELGEKMPQKSTDFYPKMITGLTMMPAEAGEQI